jgi:uncharacterized cupredoxin-like copper-binding protein
MPENRPRGRWLARFLVATALGALVCGLSSCAMTRNGNSDVAVTLTEYSITMPNELQAGTIHFRVLNAGTMDHNFEITGQGLDRKFPTDLKPGDVEEMIVDLTAGTYDVFCPISDHRSRGMSLQLVVTTKSAQN